MLQFISDRRSIQTAKRRVTLPLLRPPQPSCLAGQGGGDLLGRHRGEDPALHRGPHGRARERQISSAGTRRGRSCGDGVRGDERGRQLWVIPFMFDAHSYHVMEPCISCASTILVAFMSLMVQITWVVTDGPCAVKCVQLPIPPFSPFSALSSHNQLLQHLRHCSQS